MFAETQTFVHLTRAKRLFCFFVLFPALLLGAVVTLLNASASPPLATAGILLGLAGAGVVCALFLLARLTVTVDAHLRIVFRPFADRTIPFADIAAAEAVTYRPLRDYGGWGVRCGRDGSRAYNVRGDRGVQLLLKNGERILLGSQRAEELAEEISRRLHPAAHDPARPAGHTP